jgi:TetR/AcrR family transcriptional regulator, tetracycline repressor protein
MARANPATDSGGRRRIGVRAGLNLTRIIEAARSLDPDTLTMQALANELGVDRKALNHHVSDRDTLLELVAADAFSASFSAVHIAEHLRWQEACHAYARGFTRSVIATGLLADRIRLSDPLVTQVLQPTEAILTKMVEGGFDDEFAVRSLALLTNICTAFARDAVLASRSGVSPRPHLLRKSLEGRDARDFENLARIAALPASTYDEAQLEHSIEVFIRGTEAMLGRKLR